MTWQSFKKVGRRRGVSKWGTVWIDRPCVSLSKNGLSFNREAAHIGLVYGAAVEVLFDASKPGMIALRILDADEAAGQFADRAWVIQRNGSGKTDYGTRISNRGMAAVIGQQYFGKCAAIEKQGSLLVAQFQPPLPNELPIVNADADAAIDLDAIRKEYPDDAIVSGKKEASAALGMRCSRLDVIPVETVRTGAIVINRYRVRDLRIWHAKLKRSPWASMYGNGR